MKRPSDRIITFVLALLGIFVIFALGRIAVWIFFPAERVEIEEDFESRQQQKLLARN